MKSRTLRTLAALTLAAAPAFGQLSEEQAAGAGGQDDVVDLITPAAQVHFDAAQRAAGQDWSGPLQLCNQARPKDLRWKFAGTMERRGAGPSNAELLRMGKTRAEFIAGGGVNIAAPAPTRLFDNFYYLGIESVSAWALDTPGGIIIIDALENKAQWVERMEPGMRKLGLDPARIKYVVLTHGHGDHFGGAAYLKQKYGARVLMSAVDWDVAPRMLDKPYFDPPPPRDMVIQDGQKLRLGGQTIRLHLTPGHTRGTVSMLIPVKDGRRKHVAALWGGTGFNFPHTPDRFKIYADSAVRFRKFAKAAGADVPLSPHPDFDSAIHKIGRLQKRAAGDPHPFVLGNDSVSRLLTSASECALAYSAQLRVQ